MSPAPARTSRDAIVSAARAILEEDGLDAVVMSRVAERVGVRGPSLYKHVANRAALIRAVAEGVTADLARTLSVAAATGEPQCGHHGGRPRLPRLRPGEPERLWTVVRASRARATARTRPQLAEVARPLVRAMATLVGDERSLTAARTFVSWAHGFLSMELAGAFRLGGELDAAYADGIRAILDRGQRVGVPRSSVTTNRMRKTPTTSIRAP